MANAMEVRKKEGKKSGRDNKRCGKSERESDSGRNRVMVRLSLKRRGLERAKL